MLFRSFGDIKVLLITALSCLALMIGIARAQERGMMISTGGDNNVVLQNIVALRAMGATCVRFPIYLGFQPDLNLWVGQIKHVLPFMEQNNMLLIIDMHQANRGNPSAGTTILNRDQFDRDWIQIASNFQGKDRVWFDLLNEPAMPMSVWRPIAQRAAEKIRRVNRASSIVFSAPGADVSTHIDSLRPLDGIARQVLQLHFWQWAGGSSLTGDVQSVYSPISYPNVPRGRTKERLGQLLDGVAALKSRYGTPVLIGEVGIAANHPNAARFLRDVLSASRQRGLHVCLHSFREAAIWNYESNPAAWSVVSSWLRE